MLALLLACATDPDAPPVIAYDNAVCAHCTMLVGDPDSAAALVLTDGTTLAFDDPGCLLTHVLEERPSIRHMWFHHDGQWYREGEVAFEPGHVTPMGSGLVAVPAGAPGSLTIGEASNRLLQ